MIRKSLVLASLLLVSGAFGSAGAQATTLAPDTSQNGAIRTYLDCDVRGCDREYLTTELRWINWMRNRLDADFHILVTSQQTGAGGRHFAVVAIGQRSFAGRVDTLTFTTEPNDSEDMVRSQLRRVVGQLLLPFAAEGPLGRQLSVSFTPLRSGVSGPPPQARDKWNFWTFSVSANGYLNGESRQNSGDFSGGLSANRTTEKWKVLMSSNTSYDRSNYTFGVYDDETSSSKDTTVSAIQRRASLSALAVQSAGNHLSFGGATKFSTSDFDNLSSAVEAYAVAEWNYFPYRDFARRKLAVLYSMGVKSNRYNEITIYDRMQETRPLHTIDATYGARQPWGEANLTLHGEQYLDGLKYYNAGIRGELDFRLGRGLSFDVNGSLSRVRDQLALPRSGASEQEVLTELRALQTNYRYSVYFGISYRFGSMFNNVVNPRFGSMEWDFGGGGGGGGRGRY